MLLRTGTTTLTAQARLAAVAAKAYAAGLRAESAEAQKAAAEARALAAQHRADAAAINTQTASVRLGTAAMREAAAAAAARAAGSRADSAAIAVEAAEARALAAGFNAEAAQSRAAAAASRAYIAAARANAVAMAQQVTIGQRVAGMFGAIKAAANGIGSVLAAAGGGIGRLIGSFTALGTAGFNGAKRAGQAITTFIVAGANAGIGAVNRLAGSLRRLGTGTYRGISNLAAGIGVLTAAFGVFSIRAAVKFQEQLATINTIAQYKTGPALEAVGRDLRNLAVDKGLRLDDITASYYEFLSAGIATGGEFDKLRDQGKLLAEQNLIINATADLAIGGLATQTEATKLMSFALNAYNLNQVKISKATAEEAGITATSIGAVSRQIADYFAKSVEIGVVKASEIASTFATVAASAKIAGIGLDEIAAAYASQTRRGVSAARVAVSMNRAIQDLLQPSKALRELQAKLNISFLDIARNKGIGVAFQLMRKEADRLGISFRDLFKRQEGWRFALNISGNDAKDYNTILAQVRASVNETAEVNGKMVRGTAAIQAAIRSDTVSRNIIRLQESFRSLGITIGYWFLAPVNEIIKAITTVITFTDRWLDSLDQTGKDIARQAATLIGIVAAITALGAGLQGFLLISSKIAPMFGATATGARALQTSIRTLALPFAILVGAIGGLALAIDHNIAGLGKYSYALGAMQDLAAGLLDVLHQFGVTIGATLAVLSKGGDAAAVFNAGMAEISQKLSDLGPLFEGVVTFLVQIFVNLAEQVAAALVSIAPAVAAWAVGVGGAILQGLASVIPGIISWAASVVASVGPALVQLGQDMFAWIADAARSIAPTLAAVTVIFLDWVSSVVATVVPALGRFVQRAVATVGDLVTEIGPALIRVTVLFAQWVASVAQTVIAGLIQLGKDIVGWVTGLARQIAPGLAYLTGYLVGWIQQAAPKAAAALGTFFGEVVSNIAAAAPQIVGALAALAVLFVQWVGSLLPTIVAGLGDLAGEIAAWVARVAPRIATALTAWAAAFIGWFVNDAFPAILRGLESLVGSIAAWLSSGQVIRQLTNAILTWAAAYFVALGALIAGIGAYLAGHLPEIAAFFTNVFSQVVQGIIDFLIQKGPLIAGAALLLAANFIANLAQGILRDPIGIAQAIGLLLVSAVVIGAIRSAAIAAGTLYATVFGEGGLLRTGLIALWQGVQFYTAVGAQIIKTAIVHSRAYAAAVAAAQWLVTAIGALWSGLTTRVAAAVVAAGTTQGTLLGSSIAAGTSASTGIRGLWVRMLAILLPGATASGTAMGTAMGIAMSAALVAAAAGAVVAVALIVEQGWKDQQKDIATHVGEQLASGSLQDLQTSKAAIEKAMQDLAGTHLGPAGAVDTMLGIFGGGTKGQIKDLQVQLDAINQRIATFKAIVTTGGSTSNWADQFKASVDTFDPNDLLRQIQSGIDAGSSGLDWSSAFGGLPSAAETATADANAAIKQGYADLRDSVVNGDNSLTKTVAGLKDIKILSDKQRIANLTAQLGQVDKLMATAKAKHDTGTFLELKAKHDALAQQIKDLKYAQTHLADLEKAGTGVQNTGAQIEAAKTIVQTQADALQTAAKNTAASAAALQAARTGVPLAPIVGPTISAPATISQDIATAYGGVPGAVTTAVGSGTTITGPTITAPDLTPVTTPYHTLLDGLHSQFEDPLTVPEPATDAARSAIQQFSNAVTSIFASLSTEARNKAVGLVAGISAAFRANTAVAAAASLANGVRAVLANLNLYGGGRSVVQSWLDGMLSKLPAIIATIAKLVKPVYDNMHGHSPPSEGPLSTIDTGGAAVVQSWIDGLLSQVGAVNAAAVQLAGAAMPQPTFALAPIGTQRDAFMVPEAVGVDRSRRGMGSDDTERLLRQMLAALGLNNELTARGVGNRPRAVDKVGAKGIIGEAKSAGGGRV